ncbi:DISARM system SNF2-like helicase DrmD [Desnuesiella massiliensis]|jgi:ERCC4-related helicase|uniref:DISARM system SNF2-like helicase DrmD n=1 Tax=Desnuesiella massiliensis TaxID=1650662 RepID=UPI0009E88078|nr:DISARM system SNF2-like helicase DrmD [Desnuesiella massiliensis]
MQNMLIQEYGQIKRIELQHNPYYCLSGSDIDINPHQIEAFCVAVASLKSGGVILADEVGLGKTIEAGLVIKYVLQSGAKRILIILPSNLRKQWQIELEDKFEIESIVVDSLNIDEYHELVSKKNRKPVVVICSYTYASKKADMFCRTDWDFIVFDEAHKLRNVHKSGVKTAKSIYEITRGIPKIMLTATPLQNNLLDLYGLVYFIDEKIFFDKRLFAKRYIKTKDFADLKSHIKPVVQRTLRKDVADYIAFKKRVCITVDFKLSPQEAALYVMVNDYLKKDIIYAIPSSNRTLITVVIRKLLASSSHAVAATFEVLKDRLITLKESTRLESVEKGLDYFFDFLDDDYEEDDKNTSNHSELYDRERVNEFIQHEIDEVENIIKLATSISANEKAKALLKAITIAFNKQKESGINEKVVVFTESVRTQEFLYKELTNKGYAGEVLLFNGNPSDKTTSEIYRAWKAKNFGKTLASRNVEIKHAIVDYFKNNCKILLVTDAGSEGLNLQFCNSVINYDLPWNPQKIEQRIGRCHRYGQMNDTIVINLLNTENIADRRVYEILSEKFELFEGVFGASDQALGLLESGIDFEKRVLMIYQKCNSIGEFNKEFKALEKEFERKRNVKFQELKNLLSDEKEHHSNSYKSILSDVMHFLNELKKWEAVKPPTKGTKYPVAYAINIRNKEKHGLEHGFILMGGLYNNQDFLLPFLRVFDEKGNKLELSEAAILEIMENIEESSVAPITISDKDLEKCGESIYSELLLMYYSSNKAAIDYNKAKIDNWAMLRKDYFNLEISEIEKSITEIKDQALATKNFKEKIDLKKQAEAKEKERDEMIIKFHQSIASIDEEAKHLIKDFENQFEINPVLFARVVAKF